MRPLLLILSLFVITSGVFAQSISALNWIKDIRILESKREDVVRALAAHVQFPSANTRLDEMFNLENELIRITYSSGTCSDDGQEWNVPPDVVTAIKIIPKDDLAKENLGLDLSKFRKQRTDPQRRQVYVLHDKSKGVAVGVFGERVDEIYLFPGSESHTLLCNKPELKAYYKSKRWTREPVPKNLIIDYNRPANVVGLSITPEENSTRKFVVVVDAKDPENDILTYNFSISTGRIVGAGKQVVWDLTDAEPGKHTLTAGADDGCGICGKYISRTVVIK